MKHTIRSLNAADGVTVVGEVGYYNNNMPGKTELSRLGKWLPKQRWFRETIAPTGIHLPRGLSSRSGMMGLELLHLTARNEGFLPTRRNGDPFEQLLAINEPRWIKKLPHTSRRYLRSQRVYGESIEPLSIVPHFPFMGYSYIVPEGTMVEQANWAFGIERLRRIKQLSFLHDPIGKEVDRSIAGLMFEHTRYLHVTDTLTVANAVGHNLRLHHQLLNTLNTAAFTHDTLTPAGGDSIKLVDPPAFDEDAHYPELLVGPEWEKYRQEFGIDQELLIRTINGEGFLGRILDLADKSSYLARDTFAYLGSTSPEMQYSDTGFCTIAGIVNDDPHVCALWESAYRRGDTLVFGNAERLKKFLALRALMFRELYYNPYSRFFEYLVGKGVAKYLYRKGEITREQLLREDDAWIERKIEDVLQARFALQSVHNLEHARIEEHPDLKAACDRAADYDNDPSVIAIVDQFNPVTGDGTNKFSVCQGGRIKTFREAFPRESEDIMMIMKFPKLVRLYIFVADDLHIPYESRFRIKGILKSVREPVP